MRAPSRPGQIKALAGARALPPLIIVMYHFCDAHHYVPLGALFKAPIMRGYLWVEFFFALSGFILTHAYSERAFHFGAFLKVRLARLYPLHLFTLLSILVLMSAIAVLAQAYGFRSIYDAHMPTQNTWQSFLANLFLVQAWGHRLSWNTAAWFVSVEFLLCLLFPLYLRLSKGPAWHGAVLMVVGAAWLAALSWTSGKGLDLTFHQGVYRGMAGFAIGVGMAMLFRAAKQSAIARGPEWQHSLAQAAALLALLAAFYLTGPRHSREDFIVGLAMDALVLLLAFDKGFLARLFATAPFQRLGAWSFAIYMGQTFWIQADWQFDELAVHWQNYSVLGLRLGPLMWTVEPALILALCIGWGIFLAHFIEQPADAFLRSLSADRFGAGNKKAPEIPAYASASEQPERERRDTVTGLSGGEGSATVPL